MNQRIADQIAQEIKGKFPHIETVIVPHMGLHVVGVFNGDKCFTLSHEEEWKRIETVLGVLYPEDTLPASA